jgi:VWFA-related protein
MVDVDPSLFRIYENDAPQVIDRVIRPGEPFNVTLLVDTSSSMRVKVGETTAATLAAISGFHQLGAPAMASFDRRVVVHSTLPTENDRLLASSRYSSLGRSATRLYDAIELLVTGPLKTTSTRSALVILTDGVDTASRLADAETALRRLGEASTPVYVIRYDTSQDNAPASEGRGFRTFVNGVRPEWQPGLVPEGAGDPGRVHALAEKFLRDVADISGGRLHAAATVTDLEKTFSAIATELSHQFTLAYYPTNQARDGTYRRIRVEVDKPDVRVRARAGYFQTMASDGSGRR